MTSRDFLGKIKRAVFQYQAPRLKKRAEELFPLLEQPEHQPHHSRVRRLLEWLVIPTTLCLIDYIGLSKVLAQRIHQKQPIDPRMLGLIDELEEPPGPEEQERAMERERILLTGDYAGLLLNPGKYLAMEQRILDNPKRIEHWNRIKAVFNLNKFRHYQKGMIRRTQYLERSMPPEDFYLTETTKEERWIFQAIFDLYAKRYGLFAMKFDVPLVERLTVTRTQFTTNISIPRWLKIARDDIMWEAVQETHWNPDLTWQGPKASGNELERLEMLRRIDCATIQARAEGLKGEPLRRRVEELAGLPPNTDKRTHIRWQNEIKKLKMQGAW